MRRADKEIKNFAEIERIIKSVQFCRLGMCDGRKPYIVPMSFGYEGGIFYFHCANTGRKIKILKRAPETCVEIDTAHKLTKADVACKWGMKYKSVIAFGRASFIYGNADKAKALKIIMSHYSNKKFEFPSSALNNTTVIKVKPREMTAKEG